MSQAPRRRRTVAILTGAIAGLLAMSMPTGAQTTAAAPAASTPGNCPSIMPVAQVHAGMHGSGWTVTRGNVPRRFLVDILGVSPDAIGAGRPMIIIEISDVPGKHFVANAGGIWAGMSGSPIYVGGRLVGAVSYGFSTGPSFIGGATPAADMARILSYPGASAASARRDATRVQLPAGLRELVARRSGVAAAEVGPLSRLPLPLAVSGLTERARQRLGRSLGRHGFPVVVVPGSRAAAPSGSTGFATPVAGGNFAALISYGDVTSGGVGTTTYVCGDTALAFGHPLTFSGRATFGANDADAIAIVTDPTLGPFKWANIAGLFGIVDQDRLAAIRARLGVIPSLIPITARVRAIDLALTRTGETDVTMSDFVPSIAPYHILADIDSATDQTGPGSALLHWVIRGVRSNGHPWSLVRTDRVASRFDISFEAAIALDRQLSALGSNEFDDITFTSVAVMARVTGAIHLERITGVKVSRNGGLFKRLSVLKVHPGDSLLLRVQLRDYRAGRRHVDIPLVVPADADPGSALLTIVGGSELPGGDCDFDPSACPGSFPALLRSLAVAPRSDDVMADLSLYAFDGSSTTVSATTRAPAVVGGFLQLEVTVR